MNDSARILSRALTARRRVGEGQVQELGLEEAGICNPFKVHAVSGMGWREWYMRFVKGDYVEI